jgi:hypothetical protein
MDNQQQSEDFYIRAKRENKSEDFYIDEKGTFVMTETFHLKRGFCCKNTCKHCPYEKESKDK